VPDRSADEQDLRAFDRDLQLAESEQRYRAVIDNASDMIQSVRPDGTFEFVNRAWLDTLGYTAEEVRDLVVWDIIHESSLDHCQAAFGRILGGESMPSMEATFAAKDGRAIPVEGSVTVRRVGDEIVATHGFFRDVTERVRAQELERRNEELVREEQARRLEKMAALGKLSAGLAHELNNPAAAVQRATARLAEAMGEWRGALVELSSAGLTGERWNRLIEVTPGWGTPAPDGSDRATTEQLDPVERDRRETEMEELLDDLGVDKGWVLAPGLVDAGLSPDDVRRLREGWPPEEFGAALRWLVAVDGARQSVEVLSRGSHRISELVQAVKGYTHMDRAVEQVVDIHEGIESTLTILQHPLRQMTVRREYDRDLPPLRVMGNTLNQVWTNILDNAVDATLGEGTVVIRTRREGDQAVVEIEDDGCGIPEDVRTRIFEPFFTTKPQGQGTGLGLDTVWRIVTEEHGGAIDVESEPGRTVFRVSLPLRLDRGDEGAP
jgi:PAS domain S-box-containing protein